MDYSLCKNRTRIKKTQIWPQCNALIITLTECSKGAFRQVISNYPVRMLYVDGAALAERPDDQAECSGTRRNALRDPP